MGVIRVLAINIFLSALAVAIAVCAMQLDRFGLPPLPGGLEIAAYPLFILGSLLIIWAAYTLLRFSGASGAPGDPTRRLVTVGPYRWIRNPIYLGDILLLFGAAFFSKSIALFLLGIFSIPVIDLYVRLVEEPRTERRFEDDYQRYKPIVPRWIPKILFPRGGRSKYQGHEKKLR